jgi:hypothetical protein
LKNNENTPLKTKQKMITLADMVYCEKMERKIIFNGNG